MNTIELVGLNKKFSTCYVHIGHPKTGSGAIQQSFSKHRKILDANGLYYPVGPHNHYLLALGNDENPAPIRRYLREQFNRKEFGNIVNSYTADFVLNASHSEASDIVLSSERFFNLPKRKFLLLLKFADSLANQIVIVCYVRHPALQASSAVQQKIKMGRDKLSQTENYTALGDKLIKTLRMIKECARDHHLVLRPFDRSQLVRGDVVSDMLDVVGQSAVLDQGFEVNRYNESLSYEAVLLGDAANRILPAITDDVWNPKRAQNLHKFLAKIRGERFTLPKEEMQKSLKNAGQAIDVLSDEFGLTFSEFRGETTFPRWSTATLQDIMREVNALLLKNEELKSRIDQLEERATPAGRKSAADVK